LVAQRPGDRDALPLAAGERGGQEPRPAGEPDLLQQLFRTPSGRQFLFAGTVAVSEADVRG
jgi:hypothetical protein